MEETGEWTRLLELQCGLVSAGQAAEHGWTSHALRAQVAARRWQRIHRGVYFTSTGSASYEQKVWAGVLYAGPGAVAARETALWLYDRKQSAPTVVHIAVPRSRNARAQPGLRIHRTSVASEDLQTEACPPRVRLEHAVLHAAGAAPDEDSAVAVLASAVQRRLTTGPRLAAALDRYPRIRRRSLLRDVLQMCEAGAHSLIEVRHEQIRRGHGLPDPKRQIDHDGAVVDVDYDGLVVELDGRLGHFTSKDWWKDMLRDDLHTAAGRAVLRFPGFLLLTQPAVVAHVEAAALRRRGWQGVLRCPRGCPGFPELDALIAAALSRL
ncbi:MAG TPA: type IV toxin-antitoxin system AbiEi family antitoxin domain-containing protein [Frankiaceae bacterium]|nr:type IV toxin-antitoxin system AbiEi family antitoxin domain-containing protein [Frankiaceae bacterium]